MATLTFDTHQFIRKLMASRLSEGQAEAVVDTLRGVHAAQELATRQDVEQFITKASADLAQLIADSRTDTIKWVAGMLMAQVAIIPALVKLL